MESAFLNVDGESEDDTLAYFTEEQEAELATLEEEIGLNEATLESLHSKLTEVQMEIDKEQAKIANYKLNMNGLESRQSQLRNSRDVNVSLVKSMELTLKKCILKLRRKLDERVITGNPSVKSSIDTEESEHFLFNIHSQNESLPENVIATNFMKDNAAEIKTNIFPGNKDDIATPALADDDLEKIIQVDRDSPSDANQSHKHISSEEVPNKFVHLKRKTDIELVRKEIILETQIEKLHMDDLLLRRIWSQTFPYQQNLLSNETKNLLSGSFSMYPLFSMLPTKNWLLKIFDITDKETNAKIQLKWKQASESLYSTKDNQQDEVISQILKDGIQETCLDVFAQIKYFPFISQINRMRHQKSESVIADNDERQESGENIPHIDPNVPLCPYELSGVCADNTCTFQHLNKDTKGMRYDQTKQDSSTSTVNINDEKSSFVKSSLFKIPELRLPSNIFPFKKDRCNTDKKRKIDSSAVLQEDYKHAVSIVEGDKDQSEQEVFASSKKLKSICNDSDIYSKKDKANLHNFSDSTDKNLNSDMKENYIDDVENSENDSQNEMILDTESDYIALPEIKHIDEDDAKSSDKMQTDFDLNLFSGGRSVSGSNLKDLLKNEWHTRNFLSNNSNCLQSKNSDIESIPTLSWMISFFGFKVNMTLDGNTGDNKKIECAAEAIEKGEDFDNEPQRMRQLILDLEFFGRLIDAIRLCSNAGRFDFCRSMIAIGKKYLVSVPRYQIPKEQSDGSLFKSLLETINKFVEYNFVGYGSTSFYGSFKSQTALSILSSFLMTYHETILQYKVQSSHAEPVHQNSSNLENIQSKWYTSFEKCRKILQLILFPYTEGEKSGESNSSDENKVKNTQIIENTTNYKCIISLLLSDCRSSEKCFENLLHSTSLGSSISHSISKTPLKPDVSSQQYFEENLVPLYDYIKSSITQMNEHHSRMSDKCSIQLSKLSVFTFFTPIVLAHFSVFCMLLKDNKNDKRMETMANNNIFGIGSFDHGALTGAIKLFKGMIRQLRKVESSLSYGYRMLFVPLFSFLVSLYISSGNYSEAQQTISQILFHSNLQSDSAYSKDVEYYGPEFYSEILWSQLIQLRLIFTSAGNGLDLSENVFGNETTESTNYDTADDVARACIYYEINLWKVFLPGDSNFVGNANSIFNSNSHAKKNKSEHVAKMKQPKLAEQIWTVCNTIVNTLATNNESTIATKSNNIQKSSQDVILQQNIQQIQKFPLSLLLLGGNLKHLQLVGCGLDSIPETIGFVCPKIQILKLTTNNLTRLPDSIGNFVNLLEMDICSNRLNGLNVNIGKLKMMKILKASSNKIKELPLSICDCENLTFVDLRNNEINSFPSNLPLRLSKLSTLLITGNPFCSENTI